MYDVSDKRILHYLIDLYVQNKITEDNFCREFCILYREMDYEKFTPLEEEVFDILSNVASRFSSSEQDHLLAPNAFYTVAELKDAILEAKEKLRDN